MTELNYRLIQRKDTAENWAAEDPILAEGEWGLDTTNKKVKMGDGTSKWSELEFYGGGGGTEYTAGDGIVIADSTIKANIDTDDFKFVDGKLKLKGGSGTVAPVDADVTTMILRAENVSGEQEVFGLLNDDSTYMPTAMWVDGVSVTPTSKVEFTSGQTRCIQFRESDNAFPLLNKTVTGDGLHLRYIKLPERTISYVYENTFNFRLNEMLQPLRFPRFEYIWGSAFNGMYGESPAIFMTGWEQTYGGNLSGAYKTLIMSDNMSGAFNIEKLFAYGSVTNLVLDVTSVPTLNANCFQSMDNLGTIYVPISLLETFKAAENWSTYASQMKGFTGISPEGDIIEDIAMETIGDINNVLATI